MHRTTTLFRRTLSTVAKNLVQRVYVLDIDGTTAGEYGKRVKDNFKSACRKHKLIVTDEHILPEMGMQKGPHFEKIGKKPGVYEQWQQLYPAEVAAEIDLEPTFKSDMKKIHRTFEEDLEKIAHLIKPITPKMSVYLKLQAENSIAYYLNSGFYGPTVAKILPGFHACGFKPRGVVTASDVKNGRPDPEMLDKVMKAHGLKDPAEMVVVDDGYQGILAGHNLAKLYGGKKAWTVLDLTHTAQLNADSEEQKEGDPKLVEQRAMLIQNLLNKTLPSLRPDFIVISSDGMLKVHEIIAERLKHGVRPGQNPAMIVHGDMTKSVELDLIGFQHPLVPPMLKFRS